MSATIAECSCYWTFIFFIKNTRDNKSVELVI